MPPGKPPLKADVEPVEKAQSTDKRTYLRIRAAKRELSNNSSTSYEMPIFVVFCEVIGSGIRFLTIDPFRDNSMKFRCRGLFLQPR